MRNIILTLTLALSGLSAIAQTGIGTPNPNPSAQLHIEATDKGVLIPQVALQSLNDATSIDGGNVNSLLVFNPTDTNGVAPGYYYWLETEWKRLMPKGDVYANVKYDGTNFFYTDDAGVETQIDLENWILTSQLIYDVVSVNDYMIVTEEVDPNTPRLTTYKIDIKAAMPKFFYMPTILFETSTLGQKTKDLHAEYIKQFTGQNTDVFVKNTSAPDEIPHVPGPTDLNYYITDYDNTVLSNVSISDTGVMTYEVIKNAGQYSYITVVFVVK